MERWSGKVAIVTGASVGIGAAIVQALVGNGVQVIGCARNLEKLQELASTLAPKSPGSFKPFKCDVTKEEDVLAVFDLARKEYKGLHILINNAGMATFAPLLESKTENLRTEMEVNVIALTVCTREAVKVMREFNIDDGHIVNIGSMSGHRVLPGSLHFYTATKHAVTALNIGIRNELRAMNSHIRVSQICPGLVKTEFAGRAINNQEAAQQMYASMPYLEAKDVADSVIHMLAAPPHCGIHDILMLPVEQDYSSSVTNRNK